jgi:DNA polymerase-4
VGGDVKKRKGIVLAKSIPAKQYGISTGESVFSALKKCPQLTVVSPTYGLYVKASACFIELLNEYSSCVEQYSVDECFLDYTQSIRLLGDPLKAADEIRTRMKQELGFTVNVGIAHKIAGKNGVGIKKTGLHPIHSSRMKSKQKSGRWMFRNCYGGAQNSTAFKGNRHSHHRRTRTDGC